MKLSVQILARDKRTTQQWKKQIESLFKPYAQFSLSVIPFDQSSQTPVSGGPYLLLVDEKFPKLQAFLADSKRRPKGAVMILVLSGQKTRKQSLELFESGKVDDLLVSPFRGVELLSKVYSYQRFLLLQEVESINTSFQELVQHFHEDLQLASRIQKSRFRSRYSQFEGPKGFKIDSRFLVGSSGGSDYFDVEASPRADELSFILTDSSSHGLSSAVLSILCRFLLKFSQEGLSYEKLLAGFSSELETLLQKKDFLSLFLGVIHRKDLALKYLNLGHNHAFLQSARGKFDVLESHGAPLHAGRAIENQGVQTTVHLQPSDRLILVSDGFLGPFSGVRDFASYLQELQKTETPDLLNELVFQVKRKIPKDERFPSQDCTAVVLELDSKLLRLTQAS